MLSPAFALPRPFSQAFKRLTQSHPVQQIIATGLLAVSGAALAQQGPQRLPAIQLDAGIHVIRAEVAQTEEEHEIGLMFRNELATNDGMLFIFERAGQQCFWMKNTLIPLSVAFIGDDGTVVNVDEMKAQTLEPHCSARPVRFVLEMNKGWFTKRGIRAGSKLSGQPFGNLPPAPPATSGGKP